MAQCVSEAAENHDAAGGRNAFGSCESNYLILLSLTRYNSTYIWLNLIRTYVYIYFFFCLTAILFIQPIKFTDSVFEIVCHAQSHEI